MLFEGAFCAFLAVVLENSRFYDRASMRSRRSSLSAAATGGGADIDGEAFGKGAAQLHDFVIELRNVDSDLV